jgi:hypothetical protein
MNEWRKKKVTIQMQALMQYFHEVLKVSILLSDEFLVTLKSLVLFHFHFIVELRSEGSLYPDLSN